MSARRRIAAYLELAEQDVEAAEALAALRNRYGAYHCQQAIEKLTKALLLDEGVEAGIEHHLDALIGRLSDEGPWKDLLRPLDVYTPYATAYRYPTAAGRITTTPEPQQIIQDAARVRGLIRQARQELLPGG